MFPIQLAFSILHSPFSILHSPLAKGQSPAPGQSYEVAGALGGGYHIPDVTWVNVAMAGTASDDALWFAAEEFDPNNTQENGVVRLLRWDATTKATDDDKPLGAYSDLQGDGMYPTILAPEAAYVVIAKKQSFHNVNGFAQLQMVQQDKWNFGTTAQFQLHTPDPDWDWSHHKPVLGLDDYYEGFHLCWTRRAQPLENNEDLSAMVREFGSGWSASPKVLVSGTTNYEDHCGLAFAGAGWRYLVYHHLDTNCDDTEDPGCSNGIDDDGDGLVDEEEDALWIKIAQYATPGTWTSGAHFQLPASSYQDFPSIWSAASTTEHRIFVVGQGSANLDAWECVGSLAQCSDPSNYTLYNNAVPAMGPPTGRLFPKDPKGFVVREEVPGQPDEYHHFIVYQTNAQGTTPDRVRIAAKCDSDATWATNPSNGKVLPLDAAVFTDPANTEMHLGASVSSTNPQVYVRDTTFWVAFLAQDPLNTTMPGGPLVSPATKFRIMVFEADSSDFGC